MPKFRMLEAAFLTVARTTAAQRVAAGEIIEFEREPHDNMQPLDQEAANLKAATIRKKYPRLEKHGLGLTPAGFHMQAVKLAGSLGCAGLSLDAGVEHIQKWLKNPKPINFTTAKEHSNV